MTTQPSERPDGNQLLLTGGKAPESVDFGPTPPSTVGGKVLGGPTTYHAREFDRANPGQGPLRYWPDGNPVYGVYLDLESSLGIRRLYVEKLRMTTAIQQAMLRAGVHRVEVGGHLSVTWTGTETGAGNLPANTYVAEYTAPGAMPPANTILSNGGTSAPVAPSGPAAWQQGVPGVPLPQYTGAPLAAQPQASAAPPAYAPPPTYVPPAPPAQQAPAAPQPPVLTESIAAAMRNAGIPTEGYVIVPG